jgi:hypothetical protein
MDRTQLLIGVAVALANLTVTAVVLWSHLKGPM